MENYIMHVVGNRPQFIKLSAVSRELRRRGHCELTIHTGQHYDRNMSDIFFEELGLPRPDVNLGVGSGSHAYMTGTAMIGLERQMEENKPCCVLLYGDTDSTLAAALAAAKLDIPSCHVEAGLRTRCRSNPEECNRIVADRLSRLLFCPDEKSCANLRLEGITEGVYFTGDVMYDTYLHYSKQAVHLPLPVEAEDHFALMTWHRQENTSSKERMNEILDFIEELDEYVALPLHPRTRAALAGHGLLERAQGIPKLILLEPAGYLEMTGLMARCSLIITDSGGLSKESYFCGAKCMFLLGMDVWEDLVNDNWITKTDVTNPDYIKIARELIAIGKQPDWRPLPYYGQGNAAAKIVDLLETNFL